MAVKNWQKVLYEKYDVPDNYVDESFLMEMRKNLYLRSYEYKSLVISTGRISQRINSVLTFVMCFVYLQSMHLTAACLNLVTAAAMILCILFVNSYPSNPLDVKAVVMFCLASFALSPVLMSLTNEISTDTIYAMVTVMFLVHLYTYDYTDSPSDLSVAAISFNAVIFATFCLASRLRSTSAAFSLILFAILKFTVIPKACQCIRQNCSVYIECLMTFGYFICSFSLLFRSSFVLAALHAILSIIITFVCPYILLCLQPLKNNIHGPWDEAVVPKIAS